MAIQSEISCIVLEKKVLAMVMSARAGEFHCESIIFVNNSSRRQLHGVNDAISASFIYYGCTNAFFAAAKYVRGMSDR